MTVEVRRFVTCDSTHVGTLISLVRVRRAWPAPPAAFSVYLEFAREDEAKDFSWSLRLWRGRVLVDETETELELAGDRYIEYALAIPSFDLEPKVYRIEVVTDGVVACSDVIDLGAVEADK